MLSVMALSLAFSVLTLMYGWGLQPKSWLAIVLIGFVGQAFVQYAAQRIIRDDKE